MGTADVSRPQQTLTYAFDYGLQLDGVDLAGAFVARSSGRFRAPLTGECTFALIAVESASAKLYVDGAMVASVKGAPPPPPLLLTALTG